MRALSMDLRERILAACDQGGSTRQSVADRFQVSLGVVKKAPGASGGTPATSVRATIVAADRPRCAPSTSVACALWCAKQPDLTLQETARGQTQQDRSLAAIPTALAKLGLTDKKRHCAPAGKGRPDVARARRAWRRKQQARRFAAARLVCFDEAGAKTKPDSLARTRTARRAPARQGSARSTGKTTHHDFPACAWTARRPA